MNPDDSEVKSPTIHVIREVYDSGNAHESFEAELDKALEAKVDYIIIEPTRLGDETGRWITVGNCLYKTAVLSGLSSVVSGLIWQDRPVFSAPLCAVSIFCTGLYAVSWISDPCCQYQVEKDPKKLANVPKLSEFSSPVVLALKENKKAKYFHRGVTLIASAFCAWQIYKAYK
ncbi:transmembrane protein 11 homolog, mitochondrial [Condylostylus longicornis]|uniref:transmembrane protein 11 homolog, mitochondrial n=1 Tax=Condylostylus longicornis TaxID=2530218 RepID=UPI00244DE0EF|nr:transmembrane protein 11 homolog, mitochondrial [Condylostylus longicornis]